MTVFSFLNRNIAEYITNHALVWIRDRTEGQFLTEAEASAEAE